LARESRIDGILAPETVPNALHIRAERNQPLPTQRMVSSGGSTACILVALHGMPTAISDLTPSVRNASSSGHRTLSRQVGELLHPSHPEPNQAGQWHGESATLMNSALTSACLKTDYWMQHTIVKPRPITIDGKACSPWCPSRGASARAIADCDD
jgi:hypothetical protein